MEIEWSKLSDQKSEPKQPLVPTFSTYQLLQIQNVLQATLYKA